jgi:hypothetical protein
VTQVVEMDRRILRARYGFYFPVCEVRNYNTLMKEGPGTVSDRTFGAGQSALFIISILVMVHSSELILGGLWSLLSASLT